MSYSAALDQLTRASSILLYPPHVRWSWLVLLANARRGVVRNITPQSLALLARISPHDAIAALTILTTASAADPIVRLEPTEGEADAFVIAPAEWEAWRAALVDSNARMRVEAFRDRQHDAKRIGTPRLRRAAITPTRGDTVTDDMMNGRR